MKSTPSSMARRRTRSAFSRSSGHPRIFGPVIRIAPNPSRLTWRSPPIVSVSGEAGTSRSHYRRRRTGSSSAELARDGGVDLDAAFGAREIDPLDDGVGALAGVAEDDRGDPGLGEESRVSPVRLADDFWGPGVGRDEPDDLGVLGRLEGRPRDNGPDLAVDLPEELAQLALHVRVGLARNRPP